MVIYGYGFYIHAVMPFYMLLVITHLKQVVIQQHCFSMFRGMLQYSMPVCL